LLRRVVTLPELSFVLVVADPDVVVIMSVTFRSLVILCAVNLLFLYNSVVKLCF
jgi:hypothetical protein